MHTSKMDTVKNAILQKGSWDVAALEKSIYDGNGDIKRGADLIHMLELGAVYPLLKKFENSNRVLESAYIKYTEMEERAKISARNTTTDILDILLGEGAGQYEIAPYEKVFIHNIKAMNFLMLGRVDAARVEVQRAINRHRLIKENAEFKAAQIEKGKASVRRQAQKKRINNPAVDAEVRRLTQKAALSTQQQQSIRHLRNSYENGYTYLLSSLVFGLNKEPENARPQLKNASALTDNRYVKQLFSDFQNDSGSLTSKTNLYVFAQVGFAPTKENFQLPLYNPVSKTFSNFSLARIKASPKCVSAIDILGTSSKAYGRMEALADLDLLALKRYDDDLPANITKAVLRVVSQTIKDKAILDETTQKGKNLSLYKIERGLLSVINQTLYKADIRAWNLAPKKVLFYCGTIGSPQITLRVTDAMGKAVHRRVSINPDGLNIVWVRCLGPKVFVNSRAF